MIKLVCSVCSKEFQRSQSEYNKTLKRNMSCCCSRKCASLNRKYTPKVSCRCKNCGIEFYRIPSHINRVKNSFCSKSCSSTFNTKHKTFGIRRSKLERTLESFIKEAFPELELKCNSKTEIGSELDFYFPSLKLAIEINGIYHYEPIHGKDKLTRIQNNDCAKLRACDEKGIDLIIISDLRSKLTEPFKEQVGKIIKGRIE